MKAKPSAFGPGIVSQEYEMVPVAALAPHPRNVNQGDVAAIVESIKHNRFFGAVTAQKSTSLIIAGKHRWLAAQQCGLELIPVIWADVDDAAAIRMMLVDNRTARMGLDDAAALSELLQSLPTLEGTGFDSAALEGLLAEFADTAPAQSETGEALPKVSLSDRFIVPPFSVLDARQGYWQARKSAWLALGIQSELGRGGGRG